MLSGRLTLLERVTYRQSTFLLIPNYYTTMYGKSERLSLIIITVCMPNLTGPGQVYSRLCVSFVFFSLQRHRGLVHEQFLLLNASGYSYSLLLESMPNVSAAVANRTSRAIYHFYNDDSKICGIKVHLISV